MKLYALIGERLDYSLSPLMHNALFKMSGMDARYENIECGQDELYQVTERLRASYCGANVTVPYKREIIKYLDEITGNAKLCGAVNTIINRDGRLIGDCTDGLGFLKGLGVKVKGKRVLLLGSGGAARAILAALISEGAVVDILNRSRENAVKMLQSICEQGGDGFNARVVDEPMLAYDITVNATPAGSVSHSDEMPAYINMNKAGYVYDCIYSPNPTLFLRTAAHNGNKTQNGLSMLLWQGVVAQRLWGNEFDQSVIEQVYSLMESENNKK